MGSKVYPFCPLQAHHKVMEVQFRMLQQEILPERAVPLNFLTVVSRRQSVRAEKTELSGLSYRQSCPFFHHERKEHLHFEQDNN